MYTEKINVPVAYFEWMMTDQCGMNSVSVTPNVPAMTFDAGTSLGPSGMPPVSAYQGNAAYFPGTGKVGARSRYSPLFNVNITGGFTMFVWLYANTTAATFGLGEFGYDSGTSFALGIAYWVYAGGPDYTGESSTE
jgi:hypothetical protein